MDWLFFLPQYIFFIIWEFHSVHSDHTCFPFLPCPPLHFCTLPPPQKRKKRNTKCQLCWHILVGAWPYSQWPAKGKFFKLMSPISSYWVCASCKLTFVTSIHLLDLYGDYNWVSEQVNWEFSYWVTLPVQQEEMTLQFDYNQISLEVLFEINTLNEGIQETVNILPITWFQIWK